MFKESMFKVIVNFTIVGCRFVVGDILIVNDSIVSHIYPDNSKIEVLWHTNSDRFKEYVKNNCVPVVQLVPLKEISNERS